MTESSILVVEDDADIRKTVADLLKEEGYRVATASNGRDALHLLQEERLRPHLILLDMMMPVMDGWAFRGEQLDDPELASIPVIVFSGYGSPRDTAQRLGAADILKKPLRLDEFLSTVGRTCRSPSGPSRAG